MVVTFMHRVHGVSKYCLRTSGHLRNRLIHITTPCCGNSVATGKERVPVTAQWERLRSGEKRVALFALGSALIGGFLLKYVSKTTGRGANMEDYSELPILVIAGPSGSGKSTLIKKLFNKYPDKFAFSVSHTTRQPRQGESHGKEYYFISREKMKKEIDRGNFIEWAEFSGNMYGTSVEAVKLCQKEGKVCVLDIDMQGVKSIKKTELSAVYVHIKPPSLEVLEHRLRQRKTDTEEAIEKRLDTAKGELAEAAIPGTFDYIILNDDLETAFKTFDNFLTKTFGFKDS